MRIPFTQVDAFAEQAFGGNPAAVMPLPTWLDDATLLAIAQENNLSETAFLVPDSSGATDYELRWFTPAAEIALCGHATLASGHVVLSSDPDRARVRFATRQSGVLEVARDGAGYALALPALTPAPRDLPGVVAALGVTAHETLWHDGGYAVAVLADEAEVRACNPDQRALEQEGRLLVIVTAPGDTTDIVSRAFTPAFGIPEDPVTGGAHAVIVPYWAERLGRDDFSAYQASARGGRLGCRFDGGRVVLSGTCVTTIEGVFLLP
ncbi:MAG: PhzF family phenazine biosynthesis protein [Sphingomonas phyllosphaerae]|uniref:PhzF family phenazine biosynthesis protein n=1 Tax=Sphingomonas phyllosphaerae TaxID=257003 RepID=UPI002FF5987A